MADRLEIEIALHSEAARFRQQQVVVPPSPSPSDAAMHTARLWTPRLTPLTSLLPTRPNPPLHRCILWRRWR